MTFIHDVDMLYYGEANILKISRFALILSTIFHNHRPAISSNVCKVSSNLLILSLKCPSGMSLNPSHSLPLV